MWHEDTDLEDVDVVVVPGGFSYGDYLRAGAIARFAPAMEAVARHAADGRPGAGHLQRLPGAVRGGAPARGAVAERPRFASSAGRWSWSWSTAATPFTGECRSGERLSIPVKHESGRYFAPPDQLDEIEARGGVVLRYGPGHNPNGSARDIAGRRQRARERHGADAPSRARRGPARRAPRTGCAIFASLAASVATRAPRAAQRVADSSLASSSSTGALSSPARPRGRARSAGGRTLVALDQLEDLLVDPRQLRAERPAVAAQGSIASGHGPRAPLRGGARPAGRAGSR